MIGAGFIGRSHALAINAVNRVFGQDLFEAIPHVLAEADQATAAARARQFGFGIATTDWRQAIAECDAVIIAVPSFLHRDMALSAAESGTHILCEKPVGLSSAEAAEIAAAAARANISHTVGFTYMRSPLIRYAVDVIDRGDLGKPLHFKGWHCEDYLADPDIAFTWRQDAALAGRCGAIGDMGWHIIAIARALCGQITSLSGAIETFHKTRPLASDQNASRAVENEDWSNATLRFASGATGSVEVSRIAHGRKMDIGFELVCEHGTIAFKGEQSNQIEIYRSGEPAAASGFRTIHINADHPDYGDFIPAPGHGLGFNDLKTIELRDFLTAIANGSPAEPDLDEALKISRLCEAILASSDRRCWIDAPEEFSIQS
nr:Gfo/Idh/MocA family oxidoreductase [Hoeflea prorocentri]